MAKSENNSRSILGGTDEDYRGSLNGGSGTEYFSRSVLRDSEEMKDVQCQLCRKNGNQLDDVKYCMDCDKYVCRPCSKLHKKDTFEHYVLKDVDTVYASINCFSRNALQVKSAPCVFRKVTARQASTIDLTTRNDEMSANIRSLNVVQTHYCVVTDMENMSVKVFDTRNELATSEIHLNEAESIWASTSVNDDQVAVSVSIKGKGKILFFSVSPSGIISDIQQVLDVKYPYKGIIHSNGRFYATVLNQVDVISIHGQFIETITDKSFRELWGIAVSNDHNTLYICSSNNDTVFSLNLNGKVKATFKGDELQGPLCLTIDREGYVYVCSQYTRNVHQLASDLSEGHVIISGEYVWTCAFNNTEKELCLGFGRSIKVFDIIYNM